VAGSGVATDTSGTLFNQAFILGSSDVTDGIATTSTATVKSDPMLVAFKAGGENAEVLADAVGFTSGRSHQQQNDSSNKQNTQILDATRTMDTLLWSFLADAGWSKHHTKL
jgi:hypothetical protein